MYKLLGLLCRPDKSTPQNTSDRTPEGLSTCRFTPSILRWEPTGNINPPQEPWSVETFDFGGLIHSISQPDHQQQGGVRAAAANGETLDTICFVVVFHLHINFNLMSFVYIFVKFCKFVASSFYKFIGVFLD